MAKKGDGREREVGRRHHHHRSRLASARKAQVKLEAM